MCSKSLEEGKKRLVISQEQVLSSKMSSRGLTTTSRNGIQDNGRASDLKGSIGMLLFVEIDGRVEIAKANVTMGTYCVEDEFYRKV